MGFSSFKPIFPEEEDDSAKHFDRLSQDAKDFNDTKKNSIWSYWLRRWNIMIFCCMADLICYMDRVNISAMIPMAKKYGWTKSFRDMLWRVLFGLNGLAFDRWILVRQVGSKKCFDIRRDMVVLVYNLNATKCCASVANCAGAFPHGDWRGC